MEKQVVANPQLRAIAFEVRERSLGYVIIGTLLRLLVVPVILVSVLLFVSVFVVTGRGLAQLLFFPLLLVTFLITVRLSRRSARYFVNPKGNLHSDPRPPILYLRSFHDDYQEISERLDKKTPEEILATSLKMAGPLIAIGMPQDEGVPLLGATRLYIRDGNWQEVVERLISFSQLVVFHAGTSPGLNWELEAARRMAVPEKLLISFLVWQHKDKHNPNAFIQYPTSPYRQFSSHFSETFGHDLPPFDNNTSFIYFESDWTPKTIKLTAKEAWWDRPIPFFHEPSASIPPNEISSAVLNLLNERGLLKTSEEAPLGINYLFWLFFSKRGRLSRKTFWLKGLLPITVAYCLVKFFLLLASPLPGEVTSRSDVGIRVLDYILLPLLGFGLTVKRVHDLGISGWLALLALIPCGNLIAMMILGMLKGNDGFNRFGASGL